MQQVTSKQLELLFDQIDMNHDGILEWDEFATFLMLELEGNEKAFIRSNHVCWTRVMLCSTHLGHVHSFHCLAR